MEIEEFDENREIEEEFDEVQMVHQYVDSLIDELYATHIDNAQRHYYAIYTNDPTAKPYSIMPQTSFIYEFFIFNSLYQVDWMASLKEKYIIRYERVKKNSSNEENILLNQLYHINYKITYKNGFSVSYTIDNNRNPDKNTNFSEEYCIREFIEYLKINSKLYNEYIYRAFSKFCHINTKGSWISVIPDSQVNGISKEDGIKFFERIDEIKTILKNYNKNKEIPISIKRIFKLIRECNLFIYRVRCNIFHGRKPHYDYCDPNQIKRIEIYDAFLRCTISLFFLIHGKTKLASDYIITDSQKNRDIINRRLEQLTDINLINTAISSDMMKINDFRFVIQFFQISQYIHNATIPSEKSSLFYPSSGKDFITPILLGLPFCTKFYFFDFCNQYKNNHCNILKKLWSILKRIECFNLPDEYKDYSKINDFETLDFEYQGILRKVY